MRKTFVMTLACWLLANVITAAVSGPIGIDEIHDFRELAAGDTKPKLVKPVQPVYPYNQARAGVNGVVTIEFIINPLGGVQNAYVVESNNPAFERPAINAVMQWKLSPGLKAGKPVNVRCQQKIEFSVTGGSSSSGWQITKGKNHAAFPPKLRWDEPPVPDRTTSRSDSVTRVEIPIQFNHQNSSQTAATPEPTPGS